MHGHTWDHIHCFIVSGSIQAVLVFRKFDIKRLAHCFHKEVAVMVEKVVLSATLPLMTHTIQKLLCSLAVTVKLHKKVVRQDTIFGEEEFLLSRIPLPRATSFHAAVAVKVVLSAVDNNTRVIESFTGEVVDVDPNSSFIAPGNTMTRVCNPAHTKQLPALTMILKCCFSVRKYAHVLAVAFDGTVSIASMLNITDTCAMIESHNCISIDDKYFPRQDMRVFANESVIACSAVSSAEIGTPVRNEVNEGHSSNRERERSPLVQML